MRERLGIASDSCTERDFQVNVERKRRNKFPRNLSLKRLYDCHVIKIFCEVIDSLRQYLLFLIVFTAIIHQSNATFLYDKFPLVVCLENENDED